MPDLLIADPPHQPADLERAAGLLGLAVAELKLKINYAVPEVWFAEDSPSQADEAVEILRVAGLRVARVPGVALAAVPDARRAERAALDDGGLTLIAGPERATLPAERAAVFIVYQPQAPVPPDAASPFTDVYWFEGGLRRWRIASTATHLNLGDAGSQQGVSRTANLVRFVSACDAGLSGATIDRRAANMRLRHRWRRGPVPTGSPARKGYSFASPGLDALLASIAPGLEDLDQPELTSRLAFLTWGARP